MSNNTLDLLICKDSLDKVVRNTFGIKDKDGKVYPDILSSSRHIRRLTWYDLIRLTIKEPGNNSVNYRILADRNLIEAFKTEKVIPVIISFQIRTTGEFAVCRLFKQWKGPVK